MAVGVGMDRESAILAALEAAVRQSCGTVIKSETTSEKATGTAVVESRINDTCDEMRSAFAATSLLKQDISVRTKGLINKYDVISEEPDADGRRVRVTICAAVAVFNPKNPRPGARPTLIVLPPRSRSDYFSIFGSNRSASDVGRSLETELSRELFKCKVFTILERERLASILGEQAFISSGLTDIKETQKLGLLLSADAILLTEVEDMVALQDEKVIKLTGNRIIKRSAVAKVNWKIVSVATGEILDQDSVSLALDDQGIKNLGQNFPLSQVETALMRMVVDRLVPELAVRAAPVRVAACVNGKVFINRGKQFINEGDEFEVFRLGEDLTDPSTGASLGRTETQVGLIKVERCEADFSVAKILSGEIGRQDAGSMCKAKR
jgi:curli biogenesis system outer membrane secretion channel CsgG